MQLMQITAKHITPKNKFKNSSKYYHKYLTFSETAP